MLLRKTFFPVVMVAKQHLEPKFTMKEAAILDSAYSLVHKRLDNDKKDGGNRGNSDIKWNFRDNKSSQTPL